jgi:hypothetical protein
MSLTARIEQITKVPEGNYENFQVLKKLSNWAKPFLDASPYLELDATFISHVKHVSHPSSCLGAAL